jgi:hypothetical protein
MGNSPQNTGKALRTKRDQTNSHCTEADVQFSARQNCALGTGSLGKIIFGRGFNGVVMDSLFWIRGHGVDEQADRKRLSDVSLYRGIAFVARGTAYELRQQSNGITP